MVRSRVLAAAGVLPTLCRSFLLAPNTRRFVVRTSPNFSENAGLLDHLVEALECLLEALVASYRYFCQVRIASCHSLTPAAGACPRLYWEPLKSVKEFHPRLPQAFQNDPASDGRLEEACESVAPTRR